MEENNYRTENNTNSQEGIQSENGNMGTQTEAVNTSAQQNDAAQQGSTTQQNNGQYEQRPSQLYGRTAYQQQNAQNQVNTQNANPYGNPNGYQNNYNNQYGNPNGYQNNYNNQYNYQNNYQKQPVHGKVSDIFCYFLLVIMPLSNVVSIVLYNMVFKLMEGLSYEAFYDEYMEKILELSTQPMYLTLSLLTYGLGIGFIVFAILDIVKVYRQNYKITGLILFAIFLKPGYFLWRAHVLGRKKTLPVLYTIGYCALILGQWIFFLVKVMNVSMAMVEGMY